MFTVPFREVGPRVTLLQILLNSHSCYGADGKVLTVDGNYGPNTKAAVSSASLLKGVGDPKGNAATPPLIKELLEDVELKVISSVDVGDYDNLSLTAEALKEAGDDPIELGLLCNGLQQLVNEVNVRAKAGTVVALRLVGHGNKGQWLTVSTGAPVHLDKKEYKEREDEDSYISAANWDKVSSIIAPLSRVFAPFGYAQHHGCSLGSRGDTRDMLMKLADLWGVPIRVGRINQPFIKVELVGSVFTAFPKKQDLQTWSRQFQDLILPGVSHVHQTP
jgi:hypothetical protein